MMAKFEDNNKLKCLLVVAYFIWILVVNNVVLLLLTIGSGASGHIMMTNKNSHKQHHRHQLQRQQASNRKPLSVPSAGPSWEYWALGRHVSIRSAEYCNDGKMLPFQYYSCLSPHHPINSGSAAAADDVNSNHSSNNKFSIGSILKQINNNNYTNNTNNVDNNLLRLSKSSRYMLEKYNELTDRQQQALKQKIQVEQRASQPLRPKDVLQILYCDEHICVVNKPSGVLSVPGARRNPSLANVVYDTIQPTLIDSVDQMVVHRLDMATSGIIVYALSLEALSKLHKDFKERRVQKTYQALVYDNDDIDDDGIGVGGVGMSATDTIMEGEIHVLLERDPENPPFMRVAKPKNEVYPNTNTDGGGDCQPKNMMMIGPDHKFYKQAPKESLTTWSVLSKETRTVPIDDEDDHNKESKVSKAAVTATDSAIKTIKKVTRLELRPWTGRTHQLRVHCAQVLNAPIIGDTIYGGSSESTSSSSLCLHAQKLCIYHPISGAPMIFEAAPPF